MENKKRLIDANAFNRGLCARDFDFFAKKQVKEWKKTSTADVGYSVVTIADVLDMTPTVDAVEVVHGHWVECEGTVCSVCNKHFFTDGPLAVANYRANYCPNCGAKMDGDVNV